MGNLFDELRAALHAVWMRRWIALAVAWGLCLARLAGRVADAEQL